MGKGLFDVENSVWMFLNRMTDLFLLSLLWAVCSVPIVTAGAAATGFYYTAMKISEDGSYRVWSDFWAGFRSGFRVATPAWLLQIAVSLVLCFDLWISYRMNSTPGWFLFTVNAMLLAAVSCVFLFVYPLAARYRFRLGKILRDAAVIACTRLPHTFGLLFAIVLGVAAALYFEYVYLFVPAAVGYQIARVSVWIFGKYHKQEEEEMEAGEANG